MDFLAGKYELDGVEVGNQTSPAPYGEEKTLKLLHLFAAEMLMLLPIFSGEFITLTVDLSFKRHLSPFVSQYFIPTVHDWQWMNQSMPLDYQSGLIIQSNKNCHFEYFCLQGVLVLITWLAFWLHPDMVTPRILLALVSLLAVYHLQTGALAEPLGFTTGKCLQYFIN